MRIHSRRSSFYRRPLILLLLVLVISVAMMAVCRAFFHSQPPGSTESSVWKLIQGERLAYQLKYQSDSYSDLQALYRAAGSPREAESQQVVPHAYRVTVEATAVMTVIQRNDSTAVASFRFSDARIDAESEIGAMIDTERVQLELDRAVFCAIDEDGRINSLLFDPAASGATQNFGRTLLGLMQFTKPAGSEADHWETEEDDSSGVYRAAYNAVPSSPLYAAGQRKSIRSFRKTKTEYLGSESDDDSDLPEAPKTILPKAAIDITFDFDKGRIESISGDELQTILIADKIVGEAQTKFQLGLSREDQASQAELDTAMTEQRTRTISVHPIALSAAPSERARITAIYNAQLGEDSVDSIELELDALERGGGRLAYPQVYSKVKALIFLHPESCPVLANLLRSCDPAGRVAHLLAGALATVGSAEAQDALIAAIRTNRENSASAVPLLVALGEVKRPTQRAQDALEQMAWQASDGITNAARLVLGAMAHNLKRRDPRRASDIVERASARLPAVPGAEMDLIDLLGNAGMPEGFPVLAAFLESPSPEIRGRAALSLRFIDNQSADETLSRVIGSDVDESVRLQAATAFEFRSATTTSFKALTSALLSDTSVSVRISVMNSLWRNRAEYAEAFGLIESVATKDQSKDVRSTASRLLASAE